MFGEMHDEMVTVRWRPWYVAQVMDSVIEGARGGKKREISKDPEDNIRPVIKCVRSKVVRCTSQVYNHLVG